MTQPAKHFYEFGPFRLDLGERHLRREREIIPLTPKAFDTLLMLVQNSERAMEKDELLKSIWPDTVVEENNLTQNISALRKVLGEGPDGQPYIETIPKWGYRFVARVRHVRRDAEGANEAEASLPAPPPAGERALTPGFRLARALAVALLLVGLVAAASYHWLTRSSSAAKHGLAVHSLVVLPLENLSGDPSQEYFVDGMTDALTTDLAQISALRVISRTSAMQYRNKRKPLREIARELNVDAVVEGSVVRSGDQVRISAQLIEAATDRHLWAHSYARNLTNIVALQGEVAQAIAREVRLKLTPQEQAQLTRAHPVDPQVYEAYLKGRYFLDKRTEAAVKKSVEYFEEAIKKDPAFALAYAGLADSYLRLGYRGVLAPKEAYPKSNAAAMKALELDDTLAWAHAILATSRFQYNWDWSGAGQEFKRAMELNPNSVPDWYSAYLNLIGRWEESLALGKRSRELDPLSLPVNTTVATYINMRRYDQAFQQLQKALEMEPNYALGRFRLGVVYYLQGQSSEAIAEFQKAISLSDRSPFILARLGLVYAASGHRGEATRIINELKGLSKRRYVSPYYIAMVYVGLGEKDRAFEWLERAFQERGGELFLLRVDPLLDPLRSDPRFDDLVRRMRFPS